MVRACNSVRDARDESTVAGPVRTEFGRDISLIARRLEWTCGCPRKIDGCVGSSKTMFGVLMFEADGQDQWRIEMSVGKSLSRLASACSSLEINN
jgi:hypothetical protein